MNKITIRFYEELNDFIPAVKRKTRFEHEFFGRVSVKDIIESLGVPHTEVDLIIVNGQSVGFDYIVLGGDDVSVYPEFESIDITNLQRLRPQPLRKPKFILDVHLGVLSRYMRMLGLDTLYENNLSDNDLIDASLKGKRIILTRDLGVLKHAKVLRGYFVRNTNPKKQIKEVVDRFDLKSVVKKFSRCIECNSVLEKIDKQIIMDRLPPKVKKSYDEFFICTRCDKIYWQGSHFDKMKLLVDEIINS